MVSADYILERGKGIKHVSNNVKLRLMQKQGKAGHG